MAFEIEKMANKLGGNGNGFEMERISEAVENGAGGSGGSDGGILIANVDITSMTLDKTWKQICESPFTVVITPSPFSAENKEFGYVIEVAHDDDEYNVLLFTGSPDNLITFNTDSEDGYPIKVTQ